MEIQQLEPKKLFEIFHEITQVPRPSKHEDKIIDWLVAFAKKHNLQYELDAVRNVVIRKPATVGYEEHAPIILQAHMDMVCEKNSDVKHNFLSDPIQTYIDGDWIKTRGTTLGADDGIGMAMALTVLISENVQHPAIEALFTVDEETGLTGAENLRSDMLHATRLINLDSEDDGQIFIGCSGGIGTTARLEYKSVNIVSIFEELFTVRINVKNLLGGHSGDDINKNRANANKLIAHFLLQLTRKTSVWIHSFNGGHLRNAIPREAEAIICLPLGFKEQLQHEWNAYTTQIKDIFATSDPDITFTLTETNLPEFVLEKEVGKKLIMALCACPNGVMNMSKDIEGLVQTSTNLASVKTINNGNERYIEINSGQRSSLEFEKHLIKDEVACALALSGATIEHDAGYPGWQPNKNSELLKITQDAYVSLFNKDPLIRAIHAGLECGLFLEKYPYMDMVSIGPQLVGVHSPTEKVSISSTQNCFKWLLKILENC